MAQAAAGADLPIAPHTLARLASQCPALPTPWPRPALEAFVAVPAAGPPAVGVLEALDQAGLLVRLLPEWSSVRSKPQRNRYHRFTVDRHLVEAAAAAAALTRRVARPDLLLLGALFHDLGKGLPGDQTQVGMRVVAGLAPRLGLPAADVDVLVALVQHHLLLPDVATRRDLEDPATARAVADAVGSAEILELLHALTEADAVATGPAAWSSWKAGLVPALVRRASALLAGAPAPRAAALADWQQALVDAGSLALAARDDEVTVVAPDGPGLLSTVTGVLALHRLSVRSASACSVSSPAAPGTPATSVVVRRVAPRYGALPDWSVVRHDLRRALDGELALPQVLAAREAAYRSRPVVPVAPPSVEPRRRVRHRDGARGPGAGRARPAAPHHRGDRRVRASRADRARLDARSGRRGRLLPGRAGRRSPARPGPARPVAPAGAGCPRPLSPSARPCPAPAAGSPRRRDAAGGCGSGH